MSLLSTTLAILSLYLPSDVSIDVDGYSAGQFEIADFDAGGNSIPIELISGEFCFVTKTQVRVLSRKEILAQFAYSHGVLMAREHSATSPNQLVTQSLHSYNTHSGVSRISTVSLLEL